MGREQGHRRIIGIICLDTGINIEEIVAVVHADWPHTAVYTAVYTGWEFGCQVSFFQYNSDERKDHTEYMSRILGIVFCNITPIE